MLLFFQTTTGLFLGPTNRRCSTVLLAIIDVQIKLLVLIIFVSFIVYVDGRSV